MSPFLGNIIVVSSILFIIPFFFLKKFRTSKTWQATVTPLASIIGSGFLISAPLVVITTGSWAPLAMLVITVIAYGLGSIMRFNINILEPLLEHGKELKTLGTIEKISHPTLGIAYMISVAFYLKLLAVFFFQAFNINNHMYENTLTTIVLCFIGGMGWLKGLSILEILEKYAVNIKLIIISALIIGFYGFNISEFQQGKWKILEHTNFTPWESFRYLLGILIIVQGFETSRYMGDLYSKKMRIKTMKYAQLISGFVYVTFVASAMILFNDIGTINETVVIELCRKVAPILPPLLIIAAIMSQFSAAIADTIGSSGLISEATSKFISIKMATLMTVTAALILVWATNVFEITVIASKAFALYYGFQAFIATYLAYEQKNMKKVILFAALLTLMISIVLLGKPLS